MIVTVLEGKEVVRRYQADKVEPFGAYVMLRHAVAQVEECKPTGERVWRPQGNVYTDIIISGPSPYGTIRLLREPGELG